MHPEIPLEQRRAQSALDLTDPHTILAMYHPMGAINGPGGQAVINSPNWVQQTISQSQPGLWATSTTSAPATAMKESVSPQGAATSGLTTPVGSAVGVVPRAAVFWDFENCPPPSGMPGFVVVENLRRAIHHFGCVITLFKAYLEISETHYQKKTLRSELQSAGVSLTDCPHNGRKDAADKMILVDMLAFALDNPAPATIVLISGDRDFVYALSTLRHRRYNVVLIVPNRGAHILLKSQANAILEWRYDVLHQDIIPALNQPVDGTSGSSTGTPNPAAGEQQPHSGSSTGSGSSTSPEKPWASPKMTPLRRLLGTSSNSSSSENLSQLASANTNSPNPNTPMSATSISGVPPATHPQLSRILKIQTQEKESHHTPHLPHQNSSNFDDDVGYCFSPRAPGFFDILIEVLEQFRLEGDTKPRRSKVGNEILRRNPLIYHRNGVTCFKDYAELAARENLVSLGGEKGMAWISLNQNHQDKLYGVRGVAGSITKDPLFAENAPQANSINSVPVPTNAPANNSNSASKGAAM